MMGRYKFYIVFVTLLRTVLRCSSQIQLEVTPNPSTVYREAPAGTSVAIIRAYIKDTSGSIDRVSLAEGESAAYFDIVQEDTDTRKWFLLTHKPVDKPVGFVFDLKTYGYNKGSIIERQVQIKVIEKNLYAPSFDRTHYYFQAYRYARYTQFAIGGQVNIGSVVATDMDNQTYNSQFQYSIFDLDAVMVFQLDPQTGKITLIADFPEKDKNMTFNVTATDTGSPPLMNHTMVTVTVSEVPAPDVFCVAVDDISPTSSVARICWKDPTNGSYVMKYELSFQLNGQVTEKMPVKVYGVQEETCTMVRGPSVQRNYTFTVRVHNGLEWSPQGVQRKVIVNKQGLYGKECSLFTNCSVWDPCKNGGECLVNPDLSYRCNCSEGWGGTNCTEVDLCAIHPCENNGTCIFQGDRSYRCDCPSGDKCQSKSNPCYSNPCDSGRCLAVGDKYTCKEPYCREEKIITDRTGVYLWPRTQIGDTAVYPCPHGPLTYFSRGHGNRSCVLSQSGEAVWTSPNTQECKELDETEATSILQSLMSMSGEAAFLGSEQVANITTTLEELFIFSFDNVKIAEIMTNIVGNLLKANESVLLESNFKNHSSERLLWLLDEYTSRVKTINTTHITTKNIDLHVVQLKNTEQQYTYEPQLPELNKANKYGVRLTLPKEALAGAETEDGHRLQFITFRTSSFFIPEKNAPPQDVVMKQWVVSAIVKGKPLKNLTSPIDILVKNIEENKNHTCVFWDTGKRSWSTDGVSTVHRGANYTQCHSNHLTAFSILLDPTPGFSLPQEHEKIITYLSYTGCGISMIGLVITVVTYSMFRCLNREKSGKILLNLCTSMVLMNGIFMFGSESSRSSSGNQLCIAIAIVLHYFILSTLCWMFVEAVNMYQALIKVFSTDSGYFMLKRCIFAWGVPGVIVIIIAAVDINNYSTKSELCFLSHSNTIAFYAGLLGPACLILLVNLVVFIMVSRVILKPKFKGQVGSSKDSLTPAQIRGAFTVMVLLGITWVFGPLAINEAKIVFNYVFTILNSLQGFLIFVFRCFFNPEVRMSWVLLIKTGKFKRRKGPIKSFVSDSSSSRVESRLSGSINETQKTNLYNSVGKQRSQNILHSGQQIEHHRISRKPSKDLHSYFDDFHRYNGTDNSRNSGISIVYGANGNHAMNGVNRMNSRRSSGIKSDRDEYTKL